MTDDRHPMTVIHRLNEGVATLEVTGELDTHSVTTLEQAIVAAIARGADLVEIDLGGVTFIDSAGLRCLVQGDERVRHVGGTLVLVGASTQVRRLLAITGLDGVFTSIDSRSS